MLNIFNNILNLPVLEKPWSWESEFLSMIVNHFVFDVDSVCASHGTQRWLIKVGKKRWLGIASIISSSKPYNNALAAVFVKLHKKSPMLQGKLSSIWMCPASDIILFSWSDNIN